MKVPKSFDQTFFDRYRKLFLLLFNGLLTGYLLRKLFKLDLQMAEKIAFFHPNGVSVHIRNDEFRAELWSYNHISKMLSLRFGLIFQFMHWFDIHIANRFCPSLNLGFDSYEESVDVVVFGTASRGYSNNASWHEPWEDIRSGEGTGAASDISMLARVYAYQQAEYHLFQRGIISYNTSFLTHNDVITSAGLRLYLVTPVNYTSDFNRDKLIITSHDKVTSYANQSNDIVTDDYSIDMFGTTEFCSMTWAEYATYAPIVRVFDLNSDGLAYIKRSSHTAFGLMVELDFLDEPESPGYHYDTYYTLVLPPTGSTFNIAYRSRDKQIVMMM